jgi:microcin C transport system substrate-binding protein
VQLAREHFAKAGYTKLGNDGVLVNDKGQRLTVTILHRKTEIVQKVMQRLKEEAIKAGLEYKLEGMESTSYFQKATQKKHQAASVAFSVTPPIPDHYQAWHSKDAFMEDGKTPKPNTNNLCSFADPRMDKFCEAERGMRRRLRRSARPHGARTRSSTMKRRGFPATSRTTTAWPTGAG